MTRPDLYAGNYVVNIQSNDDYFIPMWVAHVTKGIMKIGWASAFTRDRAARKASKIIARHKADNTPPKISYEYEVEA